MTEVISDPRPDGGVRRRRLGRTGLQVSEIGLGGAWLLGRAGELPFAHGVETIRHALDLGITFLDTAECYIGGRSEALFGEALEGHAGPFVLGTKFGHVPADFDWSRGAVVASVEASLRQLRRSSVDLIQVHTPAEPTMDAMFGTGGTLDGLREVRERGWCRHFGINGRDLTFLRECVLSDQFDTLLVFQRFDLFEQSALELFQEAHSRDMGIIVGSPLRLGLFGSARDQLVAHLDGDDRRHLEDLETVLSDYPGGIATAALRFALMPPEVSVVLSGASSPEEIANVVEAVQIGTPALPAELYEAIKRLASGKHRNL